MNKLSTTHIVLGAVVALTPQLSVAAKKSTIKPNVIFILTDDQGYGDLGCTGNPIVKTPNIDKFHSDAVSFTDYHVSPTSAPSRSAIMTGRSTDIVGCWHTIGGRSLLFEDETILPELLSDAGYTTGIFGKWHLGDNYPFRPQDRGFDEVVVHGGGGIAQGPDYWGNDYFSDHYNHNGTYEKYDGYCTDIFFGEAMKFIETSAKSDQPFFCYIPTNAPHAPNHVPSEYLDIYRNTPEINDRQRRFFGMITNIDDNFAKLQKQLKKLKIEDNTIVIFMTDNGTASGRTVYNAGMKGAKNSEYEGGHRVPFFIKYPAGNIGGGKEIGELTAHIDFLPTIAELCGVSIEPITKSLHGVSLYPLISGEVSDLGDRTIVIDSQRRQNLMKWNKTSVMEDKWRLVNGVELYNIADDPGQERDLATKYPDRVEAMRTNYDRWWDEIIESGANERYAYITAGGDENPLRINAHDLHAEAVGAHHQFGALTGVNPLGVYKIRIADEGKYRFQLCRYPLESGLSFDAVVPERMPTDEIETKAPASTKLDLESVELNISKYTVTRDVDLSKQSVDIELDIEAGNYDLDAFFKDKVGVKYPIYYLYIEKL